MDSLGINISPEGIAEVLGKLSSYLNKDKNALCLSLFLTYASVERSYNNLVKALSPVMARLVQGNKMEDVLTNEISDLIMYFFTREDGAVVQNCSDFIENILKRYEHGELRSIADKIEIQKIRRLSELLKRYSSVLYVGENVRVELWHTMDFRILQNWLSEQDDIREGVRQTVSQIENDLGCQNDKIQMLWTRLAS